MTIVASNLIFNGNAAAQTSYVTASVSPATNALILMSVGSLNAGSTIPTVTGASMTWTQVATQVEGGASNRRITMFRALSGSPGSGALTIDFAGNSITNCTWAVDQFTGIDISGVNGANAIVQSVSKTTTATNTGDNVTLATLKSSRNMAYGTIRNNGSIAIVKGAALTELSNQNTIQVLGTEYAFGQTVMNWTWASQAAITVLIAAEIKDNAPDWYRPPWHDLPDWW